MKYKHWLCASVCVLAGWGCASGPPVARSPGYMDQPVDQLVVGQCHVDPEIHTIRHAIQLDRPGLLSVKAAVDDGALNAEILLRDPSGLFVQQIVTSPDKANYAMNVPVERGTWEVVVVCRKGTARYSMQANFRQPVAMGEPR